MALGLSDVQTVPKAPGVPGLQLTHSFSVQCTEIRDLSSFWHHSRYLHAPHACPCGQAVSIISRTPPTRVLSPSACKGLGQGSGRLLRNPEQGASPEGHGRGHVARKTAETVAGLGRAQSRSATPASGSETGTPCAAPPVALKGKYSSRDGVSDRSKQEGTAAPAAAAGCQRPACLEAARLGDSPHAGSKCQPRVVWGPCICPQETCLVGGAPKRVVSLRWGPRSQLCVFLLYLRTDKCVT